MAPIYVETTIVGGWGSITRSYICGNTWEFLRISGIEDAGLPASTGSPRTFECGFGDDAGLILYNYLIPSLHNFNWASSSGIHMQSKATKFIGRKGVFIPRAISMLRKLQRNTTTSFLLFQAGTLHDIVDEQRNVEKND